MSIKNDSGKPPTRSRARQGETSLLSPASLCSPVWVFECPICWQKIPESETAQHLERHSLAIAEAEKLIDEIMRGQVNAEDECEKWLREFAPGYLANNAELSDQ